jgi:hypothetical protein
MRWKMFSLSAVLAAGVSVLALPTNVMGVGGPSGTLLILFVVMGQSQEAEFLVRSHFPPAFGQMAEQPFRLTLTAPNSTAEPCTQTIDFTTLLSPGMNTISVKKDRSGRPLLIVAEDVEGEPLAACIDAARRWILELERPLPKNVVATSRSPEEILSMLEKTAWYANLTPFGVFLVNEGGNTVTAELGKAAPDNSLTLRFTNISTVP